MFLNNTNKKLVWPSLPYLYYRKGTYKNKRNLKNNMSLDIFIYHQFPNDRENIKIKQVAIQFWSKYILENAGTDYDKYIALLPVCVHLNEQKHHFIQNISNTSEVLSIESKESIWSDLCRCKECIWFMRQYLYNNAGNQLVSCFQSVNIIAFLLKNAVGIYFITETTQCWRQACVFDKIYITIGK